MKLEYSLVLLANFLFFGAHATNRCVFFSEGWFQESGVCQLLSIPRFGELEAEPIALIEGIESMQSPGDFLRAIGDGYQYETEGPYGNEHGTEETNFIREYSTIHVVVTGYEHLCCRGELSVTFLNGMLQGVEFYPDNASEYLGHLKDNYGIDITSGTHEQGHLRVSRARVQGFMPGWWHGYSRSSSQGDEKRIVVVWEDTRFDWWRDLWLRKFSSS